MSFLTTTDIRCFKRPIKVFFGLFTDYKSHHIDRNKLRFARWGEDNWHKWEMWATCEYCGVTMHRFGISEQELSEYGLLELAKEKCSPS